MKRLTTAVLAALLALVCTPACFSPSGGSPFAGQLEFTGEGIAAYDLNTLMVVADGAVSARLLDISTGLPYWLPLVDSGNAIWIRIRDLDGERFEGKWDRLPPPDVTVLPADLALYGRVLQPAQLAQWRIAFADE